MRNGISRTLAIASAAALIGMTIVAMAGGTVITGPGALSNNSVTDARLRDSAALSVIGRSANTTGDPADITAGTDAYVLRRSGTSLGFGQVASGGIADAAITNAKLRDSTGLSVIGNSSNVTTGPADISASADGYVLRRSGTSLAFGTIATAGITDAAVTYAKIQDVSASSRILGRYTSGSGDVEELTGAQVGEIVTGVKIGYQVLTGASGTYTPTSGTKRVRLRMTGAGGGGGAADSGAGGSASFGGGGASGTYLEKWIDPSATITGGSWTGSTAGGAGGTGGTGTGTTGTDATIVIQGTTYTAKGGPGGAGMATSSSPATTAFAWLTSNSSGPADYIVASPGTPGARYANGVGDPGSGGSNPFGGGAGVTGYPATGEAAIGYGGGGGGAVAWNTGDKDGGAGSPTLIIVDEYR
jgi:hypothetical protein